MLEPLENKGFLRLKAGNGQDAGRMIFRHICGIYQPKSERLYAILA